MTVDEEHNGAVEVEKPQEDDGSDVDLTKSAPATTHTNSLADLFANPMAHNKAFPPLYTRPVQRQKWGDTQIHPVVNWGDLFFDLFYVGAAYNLSYIIVYEPTQQEGLLYFLGAFLPIIILWMDKTFYDARFFTHDDLLHRGFEILGLCFLATAVVHIRPVGILQQSSKYADMFGLALGLTISTLFTVSRYVEIWLWVEGGPEAKMEAKRTIAMKLIPFSTYLAATIIAGLDYYREDDSYDNVDSSYANSTDDYHTDDEHHRLLAGEESAYTAKNDVPIWLLLGGSVAWFLGFVLYVICFLPGGGRHKEISVPNNISFVIHRYGEWIMLLLGESILALVIVDVLHPAPGYYYTFYAGIISVVLLQYLHYRSQPHHPDDHAMRKSKEQGIAFSMLMVIYSCALVAVGTAYKMLVNEHAIGSDTYGGDDHRLLYASVAPTLQRMLAGGDAPQLSTEERQQRIANLFCESMAITWLCSEMLMGIHKAGFKGNWGRCKCEHSNKQKKTCVLFILVKIGLIAFMATLPLYLTDPTALALIGLGGIIAQVCLRFLGSVVFPDKPAGACPMKDKGGKDGGDSDDDSMEEKWPNVTRARAEHEPSQEERGVGDKRMSCPLP